MKTLAKSLSINHYNLSLSTRNPDGSDKSIPSEFHQIFKNEMIDLIMSLKKESPEFAPLGFSRNILIVGAGASINAYKEVFTAYQMIPKVYHQLGVYNMIAGRAITEGKQTESLLNKSIKQVLVENKICKNISRKFFHDAFSQLNQVVDTSVKFEDLMGKLGFEDSLKILNDFVRKEDLSKKIVGLLNYRYIPNLFYELAAHLFKHRFIDVIINLNFDEMLDNAIEDEMGDSDWIKITNDASCVKYEKAIIDNRLRVPIYVKPHGTISDIDSLLYSVPEYLNLSTSIRELLKKIFEGKCDDKRTKQFNIIGVGYAFNDTDILGELYKNLRNNNSVEGVDKLKTKIYILNTSPLKALSNLNKRFDSFFGEMKGFSDKISKAINDDDLKKFEIRLGKIRRKESREDLKEEVHILTEYNEYLSKRSEKFLKNIVLIPLSKFQDNDHNLNHKFLSLFKDIQAQFKKPFVPSGPSRHLFNCQIFTVDYFEDFFKNKIEERKVEVLLKHRAVANFLFDFLKFNGKVPINVLTNDRVGKYYKLYRESSKEPLSLYELIKHYFGEGIAITGDYFLHADYYASCYHTACKEDKKKQIWSNVLSQVFSAIQKINTKLKLEKDIQSLFKVSIKEFDNYFDNIPYSGSHEINPKYYDHKHLIFNPFNSKNIINTNLSLTWHFYDFVVNNQDNWDIMEMFSYSGSAIINLDKYSDERPSYLEKLFRNRKEIRLFHSIIEPVYFLKNDTEHLKPISILETIGNLRKENNGKFENHEINKLPFFHNMTLFSKRVDSKKDPIPKYGIYFFNPPDNTRVNPVWFSFDDDNSDGFNLETIAKFIARAKEDIKKT